jgi:hypothetical protein
MSILGAYPLTVFVANIFNPASNTVINVKHYHHPTYYDDKTKSYTVAKIQTGDDAKSYSIHPGHTIGFPMYLGDEQLEIWLENSPTENYSVQVGAKAGCTLDDPDGESIPPTVPTDLGEKKDENGNVVFYKGGTWTISPEQGKQEQWTLRIQKYTFDPESDNVVIGPGTPG